MLEEDNRSPGSDENDFTIHCTAESMSFMTALVVFTPLVPSRQRTERPRWILSTQWFCTTAEEPKTLVECCYKTALLCWEESIFTFQETNLFSAPQETYYFNFPSKVRCINYGMIIQWNITHACK